MITQTCILFLTLVVFQGECCRINKMVMNPFRDCTDIQSTIACPPRFLRHNPTYHHRPLTCPTLPDCEPYAPKITSTMIPTQLDCMDPLLTKCCCYQCTKPLPCQDMSIQMLPNDCWC